MDFSPSLNLGEGLAGLCVVAFLHQAGILTLRDAEAALRDARACLKEVMFAKIMGCLGLISYYLVIQ